MPVSRGAIIFDLDGTITRPCLDFDAIRAEIGLPPGPILEQITHLPADQQARAHGILETHERRAAERSELQEGAKEVIERIGAAGHPVAIMTRNSLACTNIVLEAHGISVDFIRTRECGAIKPSPEPVHAICAALEVSATESWVVGDYLFDIQSGYRAGTRTVLMVGDDPVPDFAHEADHVIRRLKELIGLVGIT